MLAKSSWRLFLKWSFKGTAEKKCQENDGKWQWQQNDLGTKTSPNITSGHQAGKKTLS